MKSNREIQRQARGIMRLCTVDGRLDKGRVRTAIAELRSRKPRGHLALLEELHRLVRLELDRTRVLVETAQEATDDFKQQLNQTLEARHGTGLSVDYAVTPGLLGGLRVRVGSSVLDGSVRARLESLKRNL